MLTEPSDGDLDVEELLRPCESASGAVVAVSGGPDSIALMLMAAQWARTPGRPPILVATVDHGLRPESAQEAESVAAWAQAEGLRHETLPWLGPKPKTRVQERARVARYALLDDCARRCGASMLLTAHHADDQSETILFRLGRGSGLAGLAGMARRTSRGRLIHVRPLLDISKADLVAFCERRRHPYFMDPSNQDQRFARSRLREAAPTLAAFGLDSGGLSRLARRAARAETALRLAYDDFLQNAAVDRSLGRSVLRRAALCSASEEMLVRLACGEAARVSGRAAPRLERAEAFVARLQAAFATQRIWRGTLGGVLFELRDEWLVLSPETRSQGAASRLGASETPEAKNHRRPFSC